MYYKPTLFRADVSEIAHGLIYIIRTIRYYMHLKAIPYSIIIIYTWSHTQPIKCMGEGFTLLIQLPTVF